MNRVQKREQAPRTPNAAAQWPSAWDFAKRLECVRLAGAFHGSWSQCRRKSERRLSLSAHPVLLGSWPTLVGLTGGPVNPIVGSITPRGYPCYGTN